MKRNRGSLSISMISEANSSLLEFVLVQFKFPFEGK